MAKRTTIYGLSSLLKKMNRLQQGTDGAIQDGFDNMGKPTLLEARADAPLRTGNLRKSGFMVSQGEDVLGSRDFVNPPENDLPRIQREDRMKLENARNDIERSGADAGIAIGFTTYYAFKVHEGLVTSTYKYGHTKFLERAFERNKHLIPGQSKVQFTKFAKKVARGG